MTESSDDPLRDLARAIEEIRQRQAEGVDAATQLNMLLRENPDLRDYIAEAVGGAPSESAASAVSRDETLTVPPDRMLSSRAIAQLESGDPKECGPYRILDRIGEGGMGTVYVAEQREPIRRKVALKLIKWGLDTKDVLVRFQLEHHALALMNHPHIARVLDAGATETGRPYFVMEYVPGIPLVEYCDRNRLGVPERLALFVTVCEAVQHAHQKGVIHRDLKPSNILVTLQDERPVPKIIDFGVAKAINPHLTHQTLYTEVGRIVGTLEYMSPEQADPTAVDIDTRSDVYALGVILYELLTGHLPFQRDAFLEAGLAEMQRIIRDVEPRKPSTRLTEPDANTGEAAERRSSASNALVRRIRGDLDWITMKCLEKNRTRRYAGAAALADDILRHLNDEPVSAGPPSRRYRMRKFIRKNRNVVTTGIAITIILIVALGVSLWSLGEAVRARSVAEEKEGIAERNRAEAERLAVREGRRADLQRLDRAIDSAKSLWPEVPTMVPNLTRWLEEFARPLESRLAQHRSDLDELRSKAVPAAVPDGWSFDEPELEEEYATLREVVERLDAFTRADGLVRGVEGRLEFARSIERHSVVGVDARDRWERAAREVATSDRYADRRPALTPQMGLLPLGVDRESQLQEFLHLRSHVGPIPERDAEGRIPVTSELGIILVLVPGGPARVGADRPRLGLELGKPEPRVTGVGAGSLSEQFGLQVGDIVRSVNRIPIEKTGEIGDALQYTPTESSFTIEVDRDGTRIALEVDWREFTFGPHVDPWARLNARPESGEVPSRESDLDPYFMGKYEVTQAQWQRAMGYNPSMYGVDFEHVVSGEVVHRNTPCNPVELVSWHAAVELGRRWDLTLPTEEQWERAARGGTVTPWWCGARARSLAERSAGNVADRYARANIAAVGWKFDNWLDDGWVVHAPVGSFSANPYGLHDVIGNVWEWCRDSFDPEGAVREAFRIDRGGSYKSPAERARSSAWNHLSAENESNDLGFRVARPLR